MLESDKTEVYEEEDPEEFRPKPKLQKLTFFVKSWWPDWWSKK